MIRDTEIKVSCLLVSLPVAQRLPCLKRSIADYCRQTHTARELVIVLEGNVDGTQPEIAAHVASLQRSDIRIIVEPGALSLGALRNASIAHACGDFVCQWDDDDFHHPQRIECQLAALRAAKADALCLEEGMHYFAAARTLYCLNFRSTRWQGMPGTMLYERGAPVRYQESGEWSQRGEDTDMIEQFQALGRFTTLVDSPHLYVYVNHGANTWPETHHRMLVDKLAVSRGRLMRREAPLRAALAAYDFGDSRVAVQGYNGVAFTLG